MYRSVSGKAALMERVMKALVRCGPGPDDPVLFLAHRPHWPQSSPVCTASVPLS